MTGERSTVDAAERRERIVARCAELLTVGEFALLTRCCEKTVYRRIWSGRQAGACKVGGQWRIDLALALRPAAAVQSCTVATHEQSLQTNHDSRGRAPDGEAVAPHTATPASETKSMFIPERGQAQIRRVS